MYPPALSFQGLDATADWWVVGRSWGKLGVENRWFVWVGGSDFVSNHPQNLIFSEIFWSMDYYWKEHQPQKRPSFAEEMTFRICAVITLGITWCSLSWNMDTRSIAKLWRISWKQTFWALLSIATQATWWKRPYPTALLRPVFASHVAGSDKTSPFKSHLSKPIARVYFSNLWFTNKTQQFDPQQSLTYRDICWGLFLVQALICNMIFIQRRTSGLCYLNWAAQMLSWSWLGGLSILSMFRATNYVIYQVFS